jgi:hypothetical protein
MGCKENLIFKRNNAVGRVRQSLRVHGHEPFKELIPEMSQDSRLLPSEPRLLKSGTICQEAIYLSSLLVGVKSDKTMLSEVSFTLVIGVREATTGPTLIYHNCQ